MESKELVKEVKQILEEAMVARGKEKIAVEEPPHFFCEHESREACSRITLKRTRDDLSDYLRVAEAYLQDIGEKIKAVDEKRARIAMTIAELEKWASEKEKPAVVEEKPALVVTPPPAAVPAAAPKGSSASVPARR